VIEARAGTQFSQHGNGVLAKDRKKAARPRIAEFRTEVDERRRRSIAAKMTSKAIPLIRRLC